MTLIKCIILGALQGIAEFMPISSSGHLDIVQDLMELEEIPQLFDVLLHVPTLVAVIIFYRKRIAMLILVLFRWITGQKSMESTALEDSYRAMIRSIIATTFVTAIIGLAIKKLVPEMGSKLICAGFLFTAFLLIASAAANSLMQKRIDSEKTEDTDNVPQRMSIFQGIVIGIAQGIGTLPGVSRSGSTISGALLCGVDRNIAGEYSFIAAIPAILGAFLLDLHEFNDMISKIEIVPLLAGCATAFVMGYISLFLLQKMIRKGNLKWFAVYLIPAGIIGIILL